LKLNLFSNVVLYNKIFQKFNTNIIYDIGVIMFEILEKFSPYSREARMFIADCTRNSITELINHQWIIHNQIDSFGFRRSYSLPILPITNDNLLYGRNRFSISPQNTTLSDIVAYESTSKKVSGFNLLKKIFNKK